MRGHLRRATLCLAALLAVGTDASVNARAPDRPDQPVRTQPLSFFASEDGGATRQRGQITPSSKESDRPAAWGGRDVDEPSMAINPLDPSNAVLFVQDFGWRDEPDGEGQQKGPAFWYTSDAGATWNRSGYADLTAAIGEAPNVGGDPAVVFDSQGRAHANFLGFGPTRGGLYAVRSDDGGRTWSAPVPIVLRGLRVGDECHSGPDKNYIAADPSSGTLYSVWTGLVRDPCGGGVVRMPALLSRSTDGGLTWSAPIRVNPPGRAYDFGTGAIPRVGPGGVLYVAHQDALPYSAESPCPPFFGLNAIYFTGDPTEIRSTFMGMSVSRDGGGTWEYHNLGPVCDTTLLNPEDSFAAPSLPAMAIDPATGTVVVAWSNRDARPAIHVVRSTDEGRSWSAPQAVPAVVPGGGDLFPWLAAEDGAFWLQRIEVHGALYDAYLSRSLDGGLTWPDTVRLTSEPSCDCFSDSTQELTAEELANTATGKRFLGHYMGLDVRGGLILPAWVDTREPGAPQEIWTRPLLASEVYTERRPHGH